MFTWILDRLKERSTWVGIIGLITAAGVGLTPEQADVIATAGVGIISAILAFTSDTPKAA